MNGLQHAGAFVIQFREGTDFGAGRVAGRVEHIASGRSGRFDSAAALVTGHENRCLTSAPVFKMISMVGLLGWLSGITCFWA